MSKVPLDKSLSKQEMSLIRGSHCTLKVWVGNTVRRAFKIKFTIIDTVEVILAIIEVNSKHVIQTVNYAE